MKKVVDVCTRVEGHGNIKILLQKDEISSVNFDLEIFRGFENILLDKRLIDTPRIASRICGLCHASQAIASCKAIESMYEVEPSNQSILLRRLLMIGELIKSHSMHFFFQAFPDLFVILDKQPKPLSLNELIHFDPKLTSNMYELIKIGNEIGNLFGGRSVHLITPIIGGVFFSPLKKEINIARRYLQNSINNLKWIIERFQEIFSQFAPPDVYTLPNPAYMGMHNDEKYDRYNGLLRLAQNNKIIADFPVYKHSQYFDKQEDIRGIDFYLKKDQNILVGPLARYKIINDYGIDELQSYIGLFNKEWQNSILFSNVIRLIEMMFVSYEGLSILDDTELTQKNDISPINFLKNNEGIGMVEAPRGTLIHYYHVNKKRLIDKVKLFIATEINLPIIDEILTTQSQKLYERTGDFNQIKKQAQMIIRSFDPCISCATH